MGTSTFSTCRKTLWPIASRHILSLSFGSTQVVRTLLSSYAENRAENQKASRQDSIALLSKARGLNANL